MSNLSIFLLRFCCRRNKRRHGCAGVMFLEHKRPRSKLLLIGRSDLWPLLLGGPCAPLPPGDTLNQSHFLLLFFILSVICPLIIFFPRRFPRLEERRLLWRAGSVGSQLHLQFLNDQRMAGRGGERRGLCDRCTTGFCFGSPLILLTDRHV